MNSDNTSKNYGKKINNSKKNYPYDRNFQIKKLSKKFQISEDDAELILTKIKKKNIKRIQPKDKLNLEQNPEIKSNIQLKKNSINDESEENVDSILSNLITDYNKQVSIELDNVNIIFEIFEDKIDTIKESFIRTLRRDKGKKVRVHALKDISFKIYKGEKIGIIGYNGAGKSTLLNVISGIYPPTSGIIKTQGTISPLLTLGAGFDPNYSGRSNILLNGAILGYEKDFLIEKMDEIIEFSELGEYIDLPIKNYSSGMLAKLGFSIATAVNPDILIIDEILGVGDVNFQKKSSDKIRSLIDCGTTVLLVSHSIPQIRSICDKAIWIDNGKLREIGEVNKICDNYLKDAEKATSKQLENIQFR